MNRVLDISNVGVFWMTFVGRLSVRKLLANYPHYGGRRMPGHRQSRILWMHQVDENT